MNRLLQIAEAFDDHQRQADRQKAQREASPSTIWKSAIQDAPLRLQLEDKTWFDIEWRDLAELFRLAATCQTKAQPESTALNSGDTAPKAGNG